MKYRCFLGLGDRKTCRGRPAQGKSLRTRLTVEVLEDRTVPAFLAPLDYTGASQPPIVVDVNNDSVPDLVSANGSSQGVEVFLGVGDGSFQAGKLAATGGYAATTRSGDFNHDGKIDLVVVNSSRNLALIAILSPGRIFCTSSENSLSSV